MTSPIRIGLSAPWMSPVLDPSNRYDGEASILVQRNQNFFKHSLCQKG
jgi:hypothetical protein